MINLLSTRAAWPYLRVQKGQLDHIPDCNFWSAYIEVTDKDFETIKPHLPVQPRSILDVGGGCGGINAVICEYYRKTGRDAPRVTILDGIHDNPVVQYHRYTFNHKDVASEFLIENGVVEPSFLSPSDARVIEGAVPDNGWLPQFDLITSYGAWCFHLPPSEYLKFVTKTAAPKATLIVDLRVNKPHWLEQLVEGLQCQPTVIWTGHPKFERLLFHLP